MSLSVVLTLQAAVEFDNASAYYCIERTANSMFTSRIGLIVIVVAAVVVLLTVRRSRAAGSPEHPETLTFGRIEIKLAYIKAGVFNMGSPENEAGHDNTETVRTVTLSKPFWMGATTVTRQQFAQFVESSRYQTTAEKSGRSIIHGEAGLAVGNGITWRSAGANAHDKLPVLLVSDEDAIAFCKWASKNSGRTVRLPTEAEWEYACRAGTTTPYAGNNLDELGWYAGNSGEQPLDCDALVKPGNAVFLKAVASNHCRPHPVAQKKPNAWGLYDMHGNVWQWCSDVYGDYLPGPATDPVGPKVDKPKWRTARGGDWANLPSVARSANRGNWRPRVGYDMIGFRVVVEDP